MPFTIHLDVPLGSIAWTTDDKNWGSQIYHILTFTSLEGVAVPARPVPVGHPDEEKGIRWHINTFGARSLHNGKILSNPLAGDFSLSLAEFGETTRNVLYTDAPDIFSFLVSTGGVPTEATQLSLHFVASILCVIPGFIDAYEGYLMNPDNNITIVTKGLDQGEAMFPPPPNAKKYTEGMMISLAASVIIFTTKTPNASEQFKQVVNKRTEALALAMGKSDVGGNFEFIRKMMTWKQFQNLSRRMQYFPRFKSMMYSVIINISQPLHRHLREIVRYTQMTVFNLIYIFVTSSNKTRAHTHPQVLDEMFKWKDAKEKLEKTYGPLWPWCKLINPEETDSVVTAYPFLSTAAIIHTSKSGNQSTILNLQSRLVRNRQLIRFVLSPIADKHYTKEAIKRGHLDENQTMKLAEMMCIDIKGCLSEKEWPEIPDANVTEFLAEFDAMQANLARSRQNDAMA